MKKKLYTSDEVVSWINRNPKLLKIREISRRIGCSEHWLRSCLSGKNKGMPHSRPQIPERCLIAASDLINSFK